MMINFQTNLIYIFILDLRIQYFLFKSDVGAFNSMDCIKRNITFDINNIMCVLMLVRLNKNR